MYCCMDTVVLKRGYFCIDARILLCSYAQILVCIFVYTYLSVVY